MEENFDVNENQEVKPEQTQEQAQEHKSQKVSKKKLALTMLFFLSPMIIYLVCATVSSIYQIGSISEERRHLLSMTIFVEILFQLPMVIPWVVCLVLYYFAVTRQTKRYITAFIIAMVLLGIGVSLVLCFYSLEYWWFSEISMWGLEDTIGVLNCISVVLYLSLTIIFSVYAGQLLKRIKKIK